jgi:hypothetical protein
MLVIRSAQMKVFAETLERGFEARLQSDIRRLLRDGNLQVDENEVEAQVRLGMAEAQESGLQSERDVARFVRIRCVQLRELVGGPLPAKATAILRSYHPTTEEKLDNLESWVSGYCRRRAARRDA